MRDLKGGMVAWGSFGLPPEGAWTGWPRSVSGRTFSPHDLGILVTMLRSAPYAQRLSPLGGIRGPVWTTGRTSLLSALLIVALLLCHGVLGFAHEMSCGACGPGEVQGAHQGHVP